MAVTTRVVKYRQTAWPSSGPETVACRLRLVRTVLSQRRSPDCRHGFCCDVTTLDRDVVDRGQAYPRGDAGASSRKRRSTAHTPNVLRV